MDNTIKKPHQSMIVYTSIIYVTQGCVKYLGAQTVSHQSPFNSVHLKPNNHISLRSSTLNTQCVTVLHLCLSPPAGSEEDEAVKSKKGFRSQAAVSQNAETELMLDGDEDNVSLLQEKEIDNLAGMRGGANRRGREECVAARERQRDG